MIGLQQYKAHLSNNGKNLSQVRRNQADAVLNATWTADPTYRRVYVLTPDGWKWEDAKYQFHFAQTVAKDDVDYYLQFRPKVHYPIGTYVLIPDDTSSELNLTDAELMNPFSQLIENRCQWWIIADRDHQNAYVRYNVLKCNWNFTWIYNGEIQNVYGVIRAANSYTSGVWRAERTISLDNLTGFWAPDTYFVYGDKLKELGLCDTRSIMHDQRFLLTTNEFDPKVYQVTKIVEVSPVGLFKFSIKENVFNAKRDNIKLRICDYYTNMGDMKSETSDKNLSERDFNIVELVPNENSELVELENILSYTIGIGNIVYFQAKLGFDKVKAVWDLELIDTQEQYNEEEKKYLEGLIKLTTYDDNVIAIKPSKANSLIGQRFRLSARQENGNYNASIEWEVSANET